MSAPDQSSPWSWPVRVRLGVRVCIWRLRPVFRGPGCMGRTVPMEKLDIVVTDHIEQRLLQPERLEKILSRVLDRREGEPRAAQLTSPNCASEQPKRTPNSSGFTTRSKTESLMCPIRRSRSV